jgi:hypothetical protein
MRELNARIRDIPLPRNMQGLPISDKGFPVPYFVAWHKNGRACKDGEGEPDFRMFGTVNGMPKTLYCHLRERCWLCGGHLGRYRSFVIGPMCCVNRISSEPPSHLSCALYAAKACPFLTQPRMRRNEKGMPAHIEAAGIPIDRNPGVALVWTTRGYGVFEDRQKKLLFNVGEPIDLSWWCEGRPATRLEVIESIESGLPILREIAEKQDGPEGMAELEVLIQKALKLLPLEDA